mmetsp:Transcript_17455/g.37347  ORF Transcript_17455/g.37347 Transcript_17455/m.37347 type:complete len:215 (-) Transcript_17455:774-1418(-)
MNIDAVGVDVAAVVVVVATAALAAAAAAVRVGKATLTGPEGGSELIAVLSLLLHRGCELSGQRRHLTQGRGKSSCPRRVAVSRVATLYLAHQLFGPSLCTLNVAVESGELHLRLLLLPGEVREEIFEVPSNSTISRDRRGRPRGRGGSGNRAIRRRGRRVRSLGGPEVVRELRVLPLLLLLVPAVLAAPRLRMERGPRRATVSGSRWCQPALPR